MVKLDIYGGLLGAGKTTLISQMLSCAYAGHKVAVIENEIGQVNLDAELLKGTHISVQEISSGCICCTVKGSFTEAIRLLVEKEHPEYILVEPSGVADLTDLAKACADAEQVELNRVIMVVNAGKQKKLLKVVGEFYRKQLRSTQMIYLNFTEKLSKEEVEEAKASLWEINPDFVMIETPLADISADTFPEGQAAKICRENRTGNLPMAEIGRSGKIHMQTRRKQPLSVWCYRFEGEFREEGIWQLMKMFQQEACADIWRVKGYLKMEDSKIRKIDMVFGDQFQEEMENYDDSKLNQLVIIGKKLNIPWLKEQMEQIENKQ